KTQDKRIEEILVRIEATLLLGGVLEIQVPLAGYIKSIGVVAEMEFRQAFVGRDACKSVFGTNRRIQGVILVGCSMVIPERDERPQFQRALRGTTRRVDIVLDDC